MVTACIALPIEQNTIFNGPFLVEFGFRILLFASKFFSSSLQTCNHVTRFKTLLQTSQYFLSVIKILNVMLTLCLISQVVVQLGPVQSWLRAITFPLATGMMASTSTMQRKMLPKLLFNVSEVLRP